MAARLSFFSVINVLSYRLVGSSAFEPVSSLFLARALETVDDVYASLGSSSFLVVSPEVVFSISLAALLESPVKWVYTVPGWLVGGSNLQLSFPNDVIAGLGPSSCCRGDTSWVSMRVRDCDSLCRS